MDDACDHKLDDSNIETLTYCSYWNKMVVIFPASLVTQYYNLTSLPQALLSFSLSLSLSWYCQKKQEGTGRQKAEWKTAISNVTAECS